MSTYSKINNLLYNIFETTIFVYCIYMLRKLFNSDEVLPGNNYFLLPLIIIVGAIYWQARQLKAIRENDFLETIKSKSVSRVTKVIFYFCIVSGILVFISGIVAHAVVWSGGTFVNDILLRYTGEIIEPEMPSIFWVIIFTLMIFIFSVFVSAFLFTNFFLGTIFTGASVAIALHNWLNGGDFSIGVFAKAIFDLSISDTLSYVIVFVEFLLSQVLSNFNLKLNFTT